MSNNTWFKSLYIRDSEDAVLVQYADEPIWIPKSLIVDMDNKDFTAFSDGDEINIEIPVWLAEDKEIEVK